MKEQEFSDFVKEIKASEKSTAKRFSIYSILMLALGLAITVWSVREGMRAKEFSRQAMTSKRKADSLQRKIARADSLLIVLRERLLVSHDINGYLRLGLDNFYNNSYQEAVDNYNEALRLDSLNYVIYDLRGYSLLRMGKYDEAAKSLERSVQLNPNYDWGYYNLALAYWADGKKENAKKAVANMLNLRSGLKKTMVRDPQYKSILANPEIRQIVEAAK